MQEHTEINKPETMNYQLNQIFDLDKVRSVCESFSELTGITAGIMDLENKIRVTTGLQAVCGEFHRCNKESNKRCIESDTILANKVKEGKPYRIYKCKNGLIDVAMPIKIKGFHVGNFFIGQFLMEEPDLEYFSNQAKEFGFDVPKYLAAIDKVPIYTKEYIKTALKFLVQLAETLGNIGLTNLDNLASSRQLEAEKKKLVEAEKQTKNILSAVRNGLVFIDKDFKIHWVNEAASTYIGIIAEELIHKICYNVLAKRNSPCVGCPVKETLGTGERTQGEVSIPNGRTVYITGEPMRNDKGELIGAIENFTDITEKKKAESTQRETEKKMSSIFRAAPTGIGMVKNRLISEVNPRLCEITGYSKEELLDKSARMLYPTDEDYNYVGDEKYRQIKETGTGTVETRWQTKEGSIIPVLLSSTPINIENQADGVTFTTLDISQIKNAEEALRISERNNRTWIEYSPVCTKIIDLDFNLQFMSASGIKDLKIEDINAFYGKPYPFCFYPDSFKVPMTKNLKKVKETGEIITQEASVLDLEGNELWYQSTIVPVNDDKGKLEYILVVSLETTERKQTEILLENNEEKYRMLAETITDGIVTMDLAGRITYVNLEVEKLTGFDRTYLSGRPYSELIAPECIEIIAAHRKNELSGKKTPLYEVELLNCNGEKIPVEVNTSNLLDSNGAIIGRLAVFRDITERKKAAKAILESEHKYKVLTTNTLDTIWTVDTNFNMTFVNGAVFNFLGYTPEEFISLKPNQFIGKNGLQVIHENVEQLLIDYKKGKINQVRFELQHLKKDGTLIDVEVRTNLLLDTKGKFIGFQGRSIDISELKNVEKELIAAKDKAQGSDRLKTAFLNNMSHEIRTPLNGMLGFLDFIVDPGFSTEEKQKFIDIVNKSSDRLINTVTDIIDISKIEAGQMDISREEVSVNKLLNEVLALFEPEAKLKGLSLISMPTLTEDGCRIITDNHKLYGILSNLVKNAVKFTHEGSIKIGYDLKDDMLEFYVRDTGIGVRKDRQEAIFNRFEQADIEDARVYQGSGLGLPIARSYAEMLGGSMCMTSREGEGTEFKFTVPYKTLYSEQKKNSPKTEVMQEPKDINQLRVLFAEDDEVNKQYFEIAFRNKFHEISVVETGQEAIDACRNKSFDLVLMDIKMPGMSGYTATREIRKFNKKILIIAQTAYATMRDREKALDVGCNDYITKPINKELLLEMINKHI